MRFKEELCDDMSKTIEDIWHQVKAEITEGRYALFGYCIGTLIVYELLKKSKKKICQNQVIVSYVHILRQMFLEREANEDS